MTTETKSIKTAFLLAAGLGARLKPFTDRLPKPLLPLGGKPIITYAMERLANWGVRRFIVNTHHLPQAYQHAFPNHEWEGIPIIFVHEERLLDTGGGLKNIESFIANEEHLIIHNADIVSSLPLTKLIESHLAGHALATLALRSSGHLLNIVLSDNGFIQDIRGAWGVRAARAYQFSGIYVVRSALLTHIPLGCVQSIAETLIGLIGTQTQTVAGVIVDEGAWSDIGTKEEYMRLTKEYARHSKYGEYCKHDENGK